MGYNSVADDAGLSSFV